MCLRENSLNSAFVHIYGFAVLKILRQFIFAAEYPAVFQNPAVFGSSNCWTDTPQSFGLRGATSKLDVGWLQCSGTVTIQSRSGANPKSIGHNERPCSCFRSIWLVNSSELGRKCANIVLEYILELHQIILGVGERSPFAGFSVCISEHGNGQRRVASVFSNMPPHRKCQPPVYNQRLKH